MRTGIVVDAHGSIVEAAGINADYLRVPDVLARCGKQTAGCELLIVGIPVSQRLHHSLVALATVLHRLALVVAPVAVYGTVHLHVLHLGGVDAEAVAVSAPLLVAQEPLVYAWIN